MKNFKLFLLTFYTFVLFKRCNSENYRAQGRSIDNIIGTKDGDHERINNRSRYNYKSPESQDNGDGLSSGSSTNRSLRPKSLRNRGIGAGPERRHAQSPQDDPSPKYIQDPTVDYVRKHEGSQDKETLPFNQFNNYNAEVRQTGKSKYNRVFWLRNADAPQSIENPYEADILQTYLIGGSSLGQWVGTAVGNFDVTTLNLDADSTIPLGNVEEANARLSDIFFAMMDKITKQKPHHIKPINFLVSPTRERIQMGLQKALGDYLKFLEQKDPTKKGKIHALKIKQKSKDSEEKKVFEDLMESAGLKPYKQIFEDHPKALKKKKVIEIEVDAALSGSAVELSGLVLRIG